ncbi:hypothetical protein [Paenibacillus sp. L3-i20]|uniref:hypothetical protein n=1 Tax=Paenibacillus sp. L3-i20 TaxID=2905833 RepID=UPI001EE0A022|nr:hypothetical protein [Paenibacillus sp. L3-i20]GKU77637.1 hypothetical protein L3i20_v220340 [Paenibacillus sp. L3-i20]
MYSILTGIEQGALLLLLIMSLIASNKASKLIYSRTEKELYHKARKMKFWAISLTILPLIAIATDIILATVAHPLIWMDRLLLRAPLALLTVVLIWRLSMPRLRLLVKRTAGQSERTLDIARRRHASCGALVAPFTITSVFALGNFYFIISPPAPFQWLGAILPLIILFALGALLWIYQSYRNQKATVSIEGSLNTDSI